MSLRNNIVVTIALIIIFVIFILTSTVVLELFVSRVTGPDIIKPNQVSSKPVQVNKQSYQEFKLENSTKYTNKELGFSFNYPSNWEIYNDGVDQFNINSYRVVIIERAASSSKKAVAEMTPGDNLTFSRIFMVDYLSKANEKSLKPSEYFQSQAYIPSQTQINPGIGGYPTFFTFEKYTTPDKKSLASYVIFKGKDIIGVTLDDRSGAGDQVAVELASKLASWLNISK